MIRINSHHSMSTALSPGHKQLTKYTNMHGVAVFGHNVANLSLHNVQLYGFM